MANNICYLYNAQAGIELIFCRDSTISISYPLHNHVSVLTIGIILDGSLVLTTNKETRVYKQNETFTIFPYVPHSISAHNSYTLLTLFIDKNAVNDASVTTIQKRIGLLLMQALNMVLFFRLKEHSICRFFQQKKNPLQISRHIAGIRFRTLFGTENTPVQINCAGVCPSWKLLNRKPENLNQYLGRTEPPKSAQEQPDRDNNPSR